MYVFLKEFFLVQCYIIIHFTILGVSCGDPGGITNGYKSGGYLYQDTVSYRCYDGFTKSDGDYILSCQADRTWSGTKPTCSSKYRLN